MQKYLSKINFKRREVVKDVKGKEKRSMKDRLTYLEFLERMHKISFAKRRDIVDKKKNYCNYIKQEKKSAMRSFFLAKLYHVKECKVL